MSHFLRILKYMLFIEDENYIFPWPQRMAKYTVVWQTKTLQDFLRHGLDKREPDKTYLIYR